MAAKTKAEIEQQIENEKARIEKLKKQLKAKQKAEAEKQRKERNHRLIQIGGLIEKHCGIITDLDALETYIMKYSRAIENTQYKMTESVTSSPTPSDQEDLTVDGIPTEGGYFTNY